MKRFETISFRTRRIIGLSITAIAIAIVMSIHQSIEERLGRASYFSGFSLFGALVALILIGIRRRLPMLPLGSVSTWTQIHLYTGIFAAVIYFVHVPAMIAGGVFECGLSIVFLLVTASGFYGLYASRMLPRRLTAVGGEFRYDQVPWHRNQIATAASGLLRSDHESAATEVLRGFYAKYLRPFFESSPGLTYVAVPTGSRRRRLLAGLKELDRYLEEDTRSTSGQFAALVRRRDDLDYHYALQFRLRIWVVVHSVFSVVLFAAAMVHGVLALRFTF